MNLLEVKDLVVSFTIQNRKLHAVRGVSFDLIDGEALGIVGESGCGKSVTVQSITRLIPSPPCQIECGSVLFEGKDLMRFSETEMRAIRGRHIGLIPQDPMTSLNPTMKIGAQIVESLLYHRLASASEAKQRGLELLHLVGIPEPTLRYDQYPHQLSGGMRQRALIATALACRPRILIADEPTTALDPTIQIQIIDLLKRLQKHFQMSLVIITHDIGVVAALCERVVVMYAGKIVERGTVEEVLNSPQHPYTRMLLQSLPRLDMKQDERLVSIAGAPPSLFSPPVGCPFAARCPHAMQICARTFPDFYGQAACWLHDPRRRA